MTDRDLPPPMDLRLEWSVLYAAHAGDLDPETLSFDDFTAERKLTLARLRHGTLADWELDVFDCVPAVSASEVSEQLVRLRELSRSRRILEGVTGVDAGVRSGAMTADEACDLLARALEAASA